MPSHDLTSRSIGERIEALIARLPELSRQHPDLRYVWREVDAELEAITAAVETDADQRALDTGFVDLMAKADVMGLLAPE